MPRRFIKCKENSIGYNFKGLSHNNVILRTPEIIDEFYTEHCSCSDSSDAISFVDPIRILFAQQRLEHLGSSVVEEWIKSLQSHNIDPLSELRSKLSDEEIMRSIKSRHIQQPCELQAFIDYCKLEHTSITDKLKQSSIKPEKVVESDTSTNL